MNFIYSYSIVPKSPVPFGIIIKTYNSGVFRSDLLFKNNIGVYIDNTEYTPNEIFEEIEENHYVLQTIMYEWTTEIDKISKKKHNEYIKFFETIKEENLCSHRCFWRLS